MRLPTTSPRMQRFLGGGVAALLTANAFAVATMVRDDAATDGRFRDVEAPGIPEIPRADEVELTVVTMPDGRTFVADPSTQAGRRAIDEARREGATVQEVTRPRAGRDDDGDPSDEDESSPATRGRKPVTQPGISTGLGDLLPDGGGSDDGGLVEADPDQLDGLLDGVTGTVGRTVTTLQRTVDGAQGAVSGLLDGLQGTARGALDEVQDTVPAPLDGVQDTVDDAVDGLQDVVDDTVDRLQDGVDDTVGGVDDAVDDVVGTVGGLLGSVTTLLPSATTTPPTTAPPTTTPPATTPPTLLPPVTIPCLPILC